MNRGIVVTGGGHGIGKQICLDFIQAGDRVCFIDIDEKKSVDFAEENPNLFYFYGDVADPLTLKRFIEFSLEAGIEGTVKQAIFSLNGQEYMCIDSYIKHEFTFTPAMSLYVTCDTREEIDRLFEKLSEGGNILMPLGSYPFSERFGWVNDKYGVSWQLTFEK
ncbi:SDR family NAD(P)-dependent oxidoreductase [Lachnoclostridium phytofermentans]|uniref:3-demethylubiquinone-9 3-methyltransferase n=1 Tax=Lachnoclostridium phytofermentans (strain ATCC 700394 / DSM 18823 / ISDg) TaxID=357809 RepID=A9KPB5_LACP7|nr:SDR family NAD(P)-dependent oxidoreductase [Lachnoclostridium phytofermentans]ABX41777.1 3-demethylubiquinone-9 3-methyltransferase [Lachnoclostridium phytofermentans ISDg]